MKGHYFSAEGPVSIGSVNFLPAASGTYCAVPEMKISQSYDLIYVSKLLPSRYACSRSTNLSINIFVHLQKLSSVLKYISRSCSSFLFFYIFKYFVIRILYTGDFRFEGDVSLYGLHALHDGMGKPLVIGDACGSHYLVVTVANPLAFFGGLRL